MGSPSKNRSGFAKPTTRVTSEQSSKRNGMISDRTIYPRDRGTTSLATLSFSWSAAERQSITKRKTAADPKSCGTIRLCSFADFSINRQVFSAFVGHENEGDLKVCLKKILMDCQEITPDASVVVLLACHLHWNRTVWVRLVSRVTHTVIAQKNPR